MPDGPRHRPGQPPLEAVRAACLDAALRAYEDAGIQGLCEAGRWEAAISAIRALDLEALDVPSTGGVRIRRAEPADAEALSALAERIFRETFGPDNTPADVDLYCLQAYSPALQAAEIASAAIETLVVSGQDEALVAFAQLREGPPPAEITGPAPIELVRFYVDRPLHGTGLARRLMDAVLEAARSRAKRTLWLGVWERNARAQAFYRKAGFMDVGAQTFRLGSDVQTDRVMTRPV